MVGKDFNEAAYLSRNPDVRTAVLDGLFKSGFDHYEQYGKNEGRDPGYALRPAPKNLPMENPAEWSRRDKILANLVLRSLQGLEIGALDRPLVRLHEGNVINVDHLDTEALIKKYANEPNINISDIAHIDGVWGSQTLQQCIGQDLKVDYVVASHVVEHVPDLISWLSEVRDVLKPEGHLRLAVPDRRFTFDHQRFVSRTHDVVDAFIRRTRRPLPRAILEHFSLIRNVIIDNIWSIPESPEYVALINPEIAIQLAIDSLFNGTYHDTHCWVFTPLSFADLMIGISSINLLGFECDYHIETNKNDIEFFVSMQKSDDPKAIRESWFKMREQLASSPSYRDSCPPVPRVY